MTNSIEFPNSIYEFLLDNSFKDTDEVYTNGSLLIPTFRVKQAIEHYYKPCEDAISREQVLYEAIYYADRPTDTYIKDVLKQLPPVTSQPKIDEIRKRIEEARDKDQIAEYPYNRCIKIIREVLGDD